MAIIDCKECGGKVSDMAKTCPHCGVAVADVGVKTATSANTDGGVAVAKRAKEPMGLFATLAFFGLGIAVLAFVLGAFTPDKDPEKSSARQVYELCKSDLEAADRARSSRATVIAGVCESMRSEFVQKYGVNP